MKVLASDFLKLTEKMKFPTRSLPRLGPEKPDVHPLRMQEGKRVISRKYNYLDFQGGLALLSNCQGSANPHQRQRGRGPTYVQPQRCAGRSAPSASLTMTLHLTLQDDCRRGALWPS